VFVGLLLVAPSFPAKREMPRWAYPHGWKGLLLLVGDFYADTIASPFGLTGQDVGAENQTTSLVYLTSGTGDPAENARSNSARSALGKSETAMYVNSASLQLRTLYPAIT
jgi:hypothetical protein